MKPEIVIGALLVILCLMAAFNLTRHEGSTTVVCPELVQYSTCQQFVAPQASVAPTVVP